MAEEDRIERQLQDLLAYPREDLNTELKGWLDLSSDDDKANLAKAILALANSGGGYILIGFREDEGNCIPDPSSPPNLNLYSQDTINGIVHRYAEPSFHCAVRHVPHPQLGVSFPIVIVPGKHKVPIRAKRDDPQKRHVRQNSYYVRRPGPTSELPQTGREWDELIGRCIRTAREEMLESIRDILFGASQNVPILAEDEAKKQLEEWIRESRMQFDSLVAQNLSQEIPLRYSNGIWTVAYAVLGEYQIPTLAELMSILEKAAGHETGWPPWWVPTRKELRPYVNNGVIECWLKDSYQADAAHSDFWRASPKGLLFLLRGYQEDSLASQYQPGSIFDLTIPIWRVAECLFHAERFTKLIASEDNRVRIRFSWEGLSGRNLIAWANPSRSLYSGRQSTQDSVTSEITVSANQISINLPEIVRTITTPLYEIFDFFSPPFALIQDELSRMTARGL